MLIFLKLQLEPDISHIPDTKIGVTLDIKSKK